jgi:hypothetical protein
MPEETLNVVGVFQAADPAVRHLMSSAELAARRLVTRAHARRRLLAGGAI